MMPEEIKERNLKGELLFSSSRSGGPGGQNVNKVSTRVELRFNLHKSALFSGEEKELIAARLKNRINLKGEIVLFSQSGRTQQTNRKRVTDRFYELIAKALTIPAERKPTNPTEVSERKRIEHKRRKGMIKKQRRGPEITEG